MERATKSFIKYTLLFTIGVFISICLSDRSETLSRTIFLITLGLYSLVVMGEIYTNIGRVRAQLSLRYPVYRAEIETIKSEIDKISEGKESSYLSFILRNILKERIRNNCGTINFDDEAILRKVLDDEKLINLLTDKKFSVKSLEEFEEIIESIERCCK